MMLTREVEEAKVVEPQCPRGCAYTVGNDVGTETGANRAHRYHDRMDAKDLELRRACVIERQGWDTGPASCFPKLGKDSK